jgi:proline dehydrogenase
VRSRPDRRVLYVLATSDRFEGAVRALPGGPAIARRALGRWFGGRTEAEAFAVVHALAADGLAASLDLFGERGHDPARADAVADAYVALAGALPAGAPAGTWLSLDLSHIAFGAQRLRRILGALPPGCRLQVGAEEDAHAERVAGLVIGARGTLTATVQANRRRAAADAARFAAAGVPVRLVKGAYVEDASVALPWGEPTDLAYLRLARALRQAGAEVIVATHDPVLREALAPASVEMLLGVRGHDARALAARGVAVRVYVPFGDGFVRYGLRRLAESRGA